MNSCFVYDETEVLVVGGLVDTKKPTWDITGWTLRPVLYLSFGPKIQPVRTEMRNHLPIDLFNELKRLGVYYVSITYTPELLTYEQVELKRHPKELESVGYRSETSWQTETNLLVVPTPKTKTELLTVRMRRRKRKS